VPHVTGKKGSFPEFCYHGSSSITFFYSGLYSHMCCLNTEAKISNNLYHVYDGSRFSFSVRIVANMS